MTIVELLVVISIIGMLMALLLPAVQQAREAGRRNTCMNNLRNCSLAVLNYESTKGQYPGWREPIEVALPGASAPKKIPVSWVVVVLPFLERNDVYELWRDPQQAAAANIDWPPQVYLNVLICPSSPPPTSMKSPCAFVVNSGMCDWYSHTVGEKSAPFPSDFQANGMFFDHFFQVAGSSVAPFASFACIDPIVYTSQGYVTVGDGSSYTLMLSESNNVPAIDPPSGGSPGLSGGPSTWADRVTATYEIQAGFVFWPEKNPDPLVKINAPASAAQVHFGYYAHPVSAHPGGVNASFCDGHVRYLSDAIDYGVFCLLMTPLGRYCNTPSTFGGLDGAGGIPTYPASWWYTTSNYPYLRTALVDDSMLP